MAAPPKSPLDGTISINLAVPEPPPPRKPGPLEPDLPPVVAGYRRVRLLGAGGMGLVYEAVHERLGRRAALKVLRPTVAELEDFKLRFLRESKAMAAVSHPNVVSIYDAGEADGVLYMALEYVPGGDLAKRLARRGVLAVPEAAPSTPPAWCTATSSPRTSSSTATASPRSATSAWRAPPPAPTA